MFESTDQEIVQEVQLRHLLSFNKKTSLTNVLIAVFITYVQADVLPLWLCLSWFSAVVAVNVIRFTIGHYYLNHPTKVPSIVNQRLNIYRTMLILIACVWSVNTFLIRDLYEQQVFVAYNMMIGLTAGAAVIYSIDLICAFTVIVVSLTPMLLSVAFSGNPILLLMGFAGFTNILLIVSSLKAFNHSLIEGILLQKQALKSAEEVKRLAFYDSLTGLPNRRFLLERLECVFLESWRTKRSALLFIDLDDFKRLNDTLGHGMGDTLLVQVAKRLIELVRQSDTVSRFGGDEFVVLLENLSQDYQVAVDEVERLTELVIGELNKPYHLSGIDYMSSASIGIAMLGEHGRTQDELLRHADIAMYHAKKAGRNRMTLYHEAIEEAVNLE